MSTVKFRYALAASFVFHLAVFSLAVLLAAQQGIGEGEYIAVELIQPSGGGRQALWTARPQAKAPGEEPPPMPETKQGPMAEDAPGLVSKIPASSPAAPSGAQSEFPSSGNIPGSPRAGAGYVPFHRLSKIPSFKLQTQPVYPPSERAAGAEARVIVEVYINEQGSVDDVMLIKSGGRLFDQAVMKAARDSSFEPGYRDEKPVPVRVQIPYSFKLR